MYSTKASPAITARFPLAQSLPLPDGVLTAWYRRQTLAALMGQDPERMLCLLGNAMNALSPVACIHACMVPCTIGLAEIGRHSPDARTDEILRSIRHFARSMLDKLPLNASCLWLIPHTANDITAVHLMAVLMGQRGMLARPWIWGHNPRSSAFMVVASTAIDHQGDAQRTHYQQRTLMDECLAANACAVHTPHFKHMA
jgi:hypothetical protein